VVELYIEGAAGDDAPIRSLRGFQRIHLRANESRQVRFTLGRDDLPTSTVDISVGGGQPGKDIPYVRGKAVVNDSDRYQR